MLLEGGLILHGCICGAIFRPINRGPTPAPTPMNLENVSTPLFKRPLDEGEFEPSSASNDLSSRVLNKKSGKTLDNLNNLSRISVVKRGLFNILSVYLLKNPIFLTFVASNVLTSLGFNAPFLFATDRAIQMGIDASRASFLVAAIGIGNTLGRIAFGALALTEYIRVRLHLYNGSLVICGIITIASCLAVKYPLMIVYNTAFGFFSGKLEELKSDFRILCNSLLCASC